MILILSDHDDHSTNIVIDWLKHFNAPYLRINEIDKLKIKAIQLKDSDWDVQIEYGAQVVRFDDITSFWYRRGNFSFELPLFQAETTIQYRENLESTLKHETVILKYLLHFLLKKKRSLGNYNDIKVNKLINLHIAASCGLKVPQTLISSSKNQIADFLSEKKCITKPISEVFFISDSTYSGIAYTSLVEEQHLKEKDDLFFPSLVQENIEKKYELRIFYLNGKCYSMAIFSQLDRQTVVDFRNYNVERPNRGIPFVLPNEILTKVKKFMAEIELISGSIDMIVDVNNNYYFLEVNPVGQFGMVSTPCNYFLEKKLAKFLCQE